MGMGWWHASCGAVSGVLLRVSGGVNRWYPAVRECAHFLGGAAVGALALLPSLAWPGPWVWAAAGLAMYAALGVAEYWDEAGGQARAKTVCDLLYWGWGFASVASAAGWA